MSEPDILERNIHALKELQRAAWQQLAHPSLTTFERREVRNRIKQSDGELRYYLELMAERLRFPPQPAEDVGDSLAKLNFPLFA
jgi:hypothetical protein